jgi:hypothetical protein
MMTQVVSKEAMTDEFPDVPPAEAEQPIEYRYLNDDEKLRQLYQHILDNGFYDVHTLKKLRPYLEVIAECARELPTIVDFHQTAWVLEWQDTERVRKLNFEFSRFTSVGKILALSELVDEQTRARKPFITPPMRVTGKNIRLAFRWYYTPEHVMFVDKSKRIGESL